MVNKYSGWSPYNYTFDNPLRLTDPNGKGPGDMGHYDAEVGGWFPPFHIVTMNECTYPPACKTT